MRDELLNEKLFFTIGQPKTKLDEMFADAKRLTELFERVSLERKNLADSIPNDVLISWCDEDPAARYPVAARIVTLSARAEQSSPPQWTDTALLLLDRSPDPAAFVNCFFYRSRPSTWSGSRAAMLASHTELMAQLPAERSAEVALAVRDGLTQVHREIDAERHRETARERVTNDASNRH